MIVVTVTKETKNDTKNDTEIEENKYWSVLEKDLS